MLLTWSYLKSKVVGLHDIEVCEHLGQQLATQHRTLKKKSSKCNYFKPLNSQEIKVAETICFVWQQVDYRRGKLKDKMTGEYKRAQKRVSAASRPDWRKTASCSSADFLCLTDLPSSLNFVFVCYSTPSPPTFKCPPIFWSLNEVSKQAGKMYASLQYIFDIPKRAVGLLDGF